MLLIAILTLAVYFASVAVTGYLVFGPFKHVIKRKPLQGKRYQLTDLLAFFVLFQLGFGAINLFFPDIRWDQSTAVWTTVVLLLISAISWIYGLRILWRLDSPSPLKRIVMLCLVMPFGLVVSAAALPILIAVTSEYSLIAWVLSLIFIVFILRYLSVWIATED